MGFDEVDLDLLSALTADPRSSWAELAKRIGHNPTTLSRRWKRMESEGTAWVTAYPGRIVPYSAYFWVALGAGAEEEVGQWLLEEPEVYWIESTDGSYSFFGALVVDELGKLAEFKKELESLPGVQAVDLRLCRIVTHDGASWTPEFASREESPKQPSWQPGGRGLSTLKSREVAVLRALYADGRASYAKLADASGYSERTLRRRLKQEFSTGGLVLRCDMAKEELGFPLALNIRMSTPRNLSGFVKVLAKMSTCRLVALMSGSDPLLLHFWVRSAEHGQQIISSIEAMAPDCQIGLTEFCLRSWQRVGRAIGSEGKATATVPLPLMESWQD